MNPDKRSKAMHIESQGQGLGSQQDADQEEGVAEVDCKEKENEKGTHDDEMEGSHELKGDGVTQS